MNKFYFEDGDQKFDFSISKNKNNKLYITITITRNNSDSYSWKSITYPYYLFIHLDAEDFNSEAKKFCLKYIDNIVFA